MKIDFWRVIFYIQRAKVDKGKMFFLSLIIQLRILIPFPSNSWNTYKETWIRCMKLVFSCKISRNFEVYFNECFYVTKLNYSVLLSTKIKVLYIGRNYLNNYELSCIWNHLWWWIYYYINWCAKYLLNPNPFLRCNIDEV